MSETEPVQWGSKFAGGWGAGEEVGGVLLHTRSTKEKTHERNMICKKGVQRSGGLGVTLNPKLGSALTRGGWRALLIVSEESCLSTPHAEYRNCSHRVRLRLGRISRLPMMKKRRRRGVNCSSTLRASST